MISISGDSDEEQQFQDLIDKNETSSASVSGISDGNSLLDEFNISSIDADIHTLQCDLDNTCKLFEAIQQHFKNIDFYCLKERVKDLNFAEHTVESMKTILESLKQSVDEKFMENRINELTNEVSWKFRNHSGEFADIKEISNFFRACSRLEHGLGILKKQRNICKELQKRMKRVAEASYDRVKDIQDNIVKKY